MKNFIKVSALMLLAVFFNKISYSQTTQNFVTKFNSSLSPINSQIFDNGTFVGIGSTVPLSPLYVKTITSTAHLYGVKSDMTASTGYEAYGFYGHAKSTVHATGGFFEGHLNAAGAQVRGVEALGFADGFAPSSALIIGLDGQALAAVNTTNTTFYGVYGYAAPLGGNGNIAYAGYFEGNTYCTGSYLPSDVRLKSNITDYNTGLAGLMQLKPKMYNYNTEEYKQMNLPQGQQLGFLAQDMEKVYPQMVKFTRSPEKKDHDGNIIANSVEFKAVNYTALIPVIVASVQEQQGQIEDLKKQVAELQKRLGSNNADINNTRTDLTAEMPALYQNIPNPANAGTRIEYFVPQASADATMYIYNLAGAQVGKYKLNGQGKGAIEISSNQFAAGTYLYTMIVDGKEIGTKKMILTQ